MSDRSDAHRLARAAIAPDDSVEHQVLHPYGVGIDTHSKFIQVCVLYRTSASGDSGGIRRIEQTFSTAFTALQKAHAWALSKLPGLATPADLRYCIESTGTYHLPVLIAWGGIPSVVNPLLAGSTRRKTDVLDARLLAHHSITGLWPSSFIAFPELQQLRVLWAQRREFAREATRCTNRIQNIMLRFGHTYAALHPIREDIGRSITDALVAGTPPSVPGVCPAGLPPEVASVISRLLAKFDLAKDQAHRSLVETRNFIRARDWPTATSPVPGTQLLALLQSVPSVGEVTAFTWLAEVGDPRRFHHSKQVAAFSGCDPSLKTSAGKTTSFVRRAGNMRLHGALTAAAQALMCSQSNPFGQYGRSIAGRHKRGGFKKAVGALARRIAVGLWYVHSKAEPFSFAGYNFHQQPPVPDIPVSDALGSRSASRLAAHGFNRMPALAAAFRAGKLASISGIGSTILDSIRDWLGANARQHKQQKDQTHAKATDSVQSRHSHRRPPSRPRPVPARTMVLRDCHFTPKKKHRQREDR
jgi:transposase